ncbi:MAG TPA: hypothetical protein DCE41_05700 [Cytophagales bacterium]|nr:hypothetical protein [Cytophagales bacterium]HAA23983.1 hypothetical protein [Cytophagales bacterium]HAP63250.1 hypothetical protein [Cytophagales bacterium]
MKNSFIILLCLCLSTSAFSQALVVSGGPGRIDDGKVWANQNFNVSVQGSWTGTQGAITPARWTLTNGTVNGNLVDDFVSNTSRSMQVGTTGLQGNLAVVAAQGDTQFYGLSRWIRICDGGVSISIASTCNSQNNTRRVVITLTGSGTPSGDVVLSDPATGLIFHQSFNKTVHEFFLLEDDYDVEVTFDSPSACSGGVINDSFILGPCPVRRPNGETEVSTSFPLNASAVSLYPNPNAGQDVITVQMPDGFTGFDMEVINQQGQVMQTAPVTSNKNDLNVGGLEPGIYYIRFQSDDFVGTRKLVIE